MHRPRRSVAWRLRTACRVLLLHVVRKPIARANCAHVERDVGEHLPGDTDRSAPYVEDMLSTLLVIGGVLVGLLVLLAVIVSLSARPATATRTTGGTRTPVWAADAGRPHPDAWSAPVAATTSEMPAVR